MGRALRLVVAVAVAMPLAIATMGRAVACSCAPRTAKQTIHAADAIVVGHVVGQMEKSPLLTETTVAVDGVYKGDVPAEVTVLADLGSGGGSTCAVLYPVGSTVDPLVLRRVNTEGVYAVDTCALLSLDQVRRTLGRPGPAPPAASPTEPVVGATSTLVATGISWAAVLGGIALALVLMTWALRRADRSRTVAAVTGVDELQAIARRSVVRDEPLDDGDHDDHRDDDERQHGPDHGDP
jgi:hypothetical protein